MICSHLIMSMCEISETFKKRQVNDKMEDLIGLNF